MSEINLNIHRLREAYSQKRLNPEIVIHHILQRCENYLDYNIWIYRLSLTEIQPYLDNLKNKSLEEHPLWGIPFAIKDNIDLANIPTTAACPDYQYTPEKSAFVVEQLISAGAIPIGKTNLDQFATGLVGTRSPYGACKNSIKPEMISGGSSSGSAVAVALGLASFSLGTDTAGSGRIPAFLNKLVGIKPTVGSLSANGMIPACRTLDSMSIFANNTQGAKQLFNVASQYDADDDYARPFIMANQFSTTPTIGIPENEQLNWFGNNESPTLFARAIEQLRAIGATIVTIDFEPFKEAAKLLYQGPWVAERYAAMEEIMETRPDILHPVTRNIISQANNYNAVDTFKAMYQLQAYKKRADNVLSHVDCIATPTAGTYYTIAELEADPVQLNTNLGYYTNFMNLLDYSALAIPTNDTYENNMPFGITLFAQAFNDFNLLAIAEKLEKLQ